MVALAFGALKLSDPGSPTLLETQEGVPGVSVLMFHPGRVTSGLFDLRLFLKYVPEEQL